MATKTGEKTLMVVFWLFAIGFTGKMDSLALKSNVLILSRYPRRSSSREEVQALPHLDRIGSWMRNDQLFGYGFGPRNLPRRYLRRRQARCRDSCQAGLLRT